MWNSVYQRIIASNTRPAVWQHTFEMLLINKWLGSVTSFTASQPTGSNLWMIQWMMLRLGLNVFHAWLSAPFYQPITAKPGNWVWFLLHVTFHHSKFLQNVADSSPVSSCITTTWKKKFWCQWSGEWLAESISTTVLSLLTLWIQLISLLFS